MNIIQIIEKKKLGYALTQQEIQFFIKGATDGSIPDYQLAALLMAIRINGMDRDETGWLTLAMAHSGDMLDLSVIDGVPVDKHSTGGVGDTTTLIVAPLVAACGVPVAKMSGRGLGHTGGTIDKLESIPGFSTEMGMEDFIAQVRRIRIAVIGQTKDLAPADKALYLLRDITSTVDSLPLIASSIMSKKLASGARAIVLDVKTGAGAIMRTLDKSIELAQVMVRIGADAGRDVIALVTDMDEPLGSHIGNALEVKEAIDVLAGRVQGPLLDVSMELGTQMLIAAGAADNALKARQTLDTMLVSGQGMEKLRELISAQGGDPEVCAQPSLLPQAKVVCDAHLKDAGYIHRMDTARLGYLAQRMGAGRTKKTDVIDPSVGFVLRHRIGDAVAAGDAIATVYARGEEDIAFAREELLQAITILPEPARPLKLVHAIVTPDGIIPL
ncbi:MAG: thymidine phosphorylase [Clostridiales bacterium]|nr:thymidine phosphorylase [Clostridiales bacterium]